MPKLTNADGSTCRWRHSKPGPTAPRGAPPTLRIDNPGQLEIIFDAKDGSCTINLNGSCILRAAPEGAVPGAEH